MKKKDFEKLAIAYVDKNFDLRCDAALHYVISEAMLSMALNGKEHKPLPKELINDMGYKKIEKKTKTVITYEKVSK